MSRLLMPGVLMLLMIAPAPARAQELAQDIEQLSADTYVIRRDEAPIYRAGSVTKQKKRIVTDAKDFAASKGKLAEELAFEETEHLLNEYYGTKSWEYQFRLVDDPARQAAAAENAAAGDGPGSSSATATGSGAGAASGPGAGVAPASSEDIAAATAAGIAAGASGTAVAAQDDAKAAAEVPPAAAGSQASPAASPAGKPARSVDELYDQLIKLDDLRKKGILTDEEFEVQKRKVLNAD